MIRKKFILFVLKPLLNVICQNYLASSRQKTREYLEKLYQKYQSLLFFHQQICQGVHGYTPSFGVVHCIFTHCQHIFKDITVPVLNIWAFFGQSLKPFVSYPRCTIYKVNFFIRSFCILFAKVKK
jgi:hypothetical protein